MLRAGRVGGDERQVDIGRRHAGKLDLRLFSRLLQTLHRHLVAAQVDAALAFEGIREIIDDALVKVVAAKMRIAVCRKDILHAVAHFND